MVFVFLPTGPISAFLVHQTSTRVVVVMGAVLLSLSSLLSAFAPQVEFLFFSYSLLTGRLMIITIQLLLSVYAIMRYIN